MRREWKWKAEEWTWHCPNNIRGYALASRSRSLGSTCKDMWCKSVFEWWERNVWKRNSHSNTSLHPTYIFISVCSGTPFDVNVWNRVPFRPSDYTKNDNAHSARAWERSLMMWRGMAWWATCSNRGGGRCGGSLPGGRQGRRGCGKGSDWTSLWFRKGRRCGGGRRRTKGGSGGSL